MGVSNEKSIDDGSVTWGELCERSAAARAHTAHELSPESYHAEIEADHPRKSADKAARFMTLLAGGEIVVIEGASTLEEAENAVGYKYPSAG
jgi:hypothetical protein